MNIPMSVLESHVIYWDDYGATTLTLERDGVELFRFNCRNQHDRTYRTLRADESAYAEYTRLLDGLIPLFEDNATVSGRLRHYTLWVSPAKLPERLVLVNDPIRGADLRVSGDTWWVDEHVLRKHYVLSRKGAMLCGRNVIETEVWEPPHVPQAV